MKLAEHKHAGWALFAVAFIESSVFPVPPDALLLAMVLSQPKKAFKFAAICTVGSVFGGMAGYALGFGLGEATQELLFMLPGVTVEKFAKFQGWYDEVGSMVVFLAAFTPLPYKLVTIGSGYLTMSFVPFVLWSVAGRGARFFLEGALLYFFGPKMKPFIDKHLGKLAMLFGVLVVLGFVALKFLGH